MTPNFAAAAHHYRGFCEALGIDLTQPDTKATPERVTRLFSRELTAGMRPAPFTFTAFPVTENTANQLVNVLGVKLVSLCSHHHLLYVGSCHVSYLPNKLLAGVSKIARLVKWMAAQPTVQEDLTRKLVDKLYEYLEPRFVGVKLTAQHSCMAHRGVQEDAAAMATAAFRVESGKTLHDFIETKAEFLHAIEEYYRWMK